MEPEAPYQVVLLFATTQSYYLFDIETGSSFHDQAFGRRICTLLKPFGGKLKTLPQNRSVAPAKLAVVVHCPLAIRKRKNLVSGCGAVYRV